MTLLRTADGQTQFQCDGCGRTDAGPGSSLGVKEYAVHDPNIGSKVLHHYCAGCAANRNSTLEVLDFGWIASPVPPAPIPEASTE